MYGQFLIRSWIQVLQFVQKSNVLSVFFFFSSKSYSAYTIGKATATQKVNKVLVQNTLSMWLGYVKGFPCFSFRWCKYLYWRPLVCNREFLRGASTWTLAQQRWNRSENWRFIVTCPFNSQDWTLISNPCPQLHFPAKAMSAYLHPTKQQEAGRSIKE